MLKRTNIEADGLLDSQQQTDKQTDRQTDRQTKPILKRAKIEAD